MGAAGVAGTRIPFFDTELIDNGLRGVGAHGVCVLALIRARKFVSMISAIRSYWNDGRGPILLGYAVLSYGIAAIEWLLKPGTLIRVFPSLKGNASSARESLWLWTLSSSALSVVGDCHQGHQEKRTARNRSRASSVVRNVLVHYVGEVDFLLSFRPRMSLSDRTIRAVRATVRESRVEDTRTCVTRTAQIVARIAGIQIPKLV